MPTYQDEQRIKTIIKETVPEAIEPQLDKLENKIDQILKIVSDDRKEHTLTKAKVNQHTKRLKKIEHKLDITSPSDSALAFA